MFDSIKFVPNDCSHVSNKINEKCCDFCEVPGPDVSDVE